jgi:hypothetical protein
MTSWLSLGNYIFRAVVTSLAYTTVNDPNAEKFMGALSDDMAKVLFRSQDEDGAERTETLWTQSFRKRPIPIR